MKPKRVIPRELANQAVERADHVDVWRILHAERNIPTWMREPEVF